LSSSCCKTLFDLKLKWTIAEPVKKRDGGGKKGVYFLALRLTGCFLLTLFFPINKNLLLTIESRRSR
jgi:hypothetical protein